MESEVYHIPALLEATINGLNIDPEGTYVDATFGGGGHSRAILSSLGSDGHLYGFDRDMEAYANSPQDKRFTFVHSDFRYISNFLKYYGAGEASGILADLGVSFHHFDAADRGFSFRTDSPLDMRMNRNGDRTAADLLAEYSKEEIERLLRAYTDLKRPGYIASAIEKARNQKPITTTFELAEAVRGSINPRAEKKDLAQVFQALRIEVNGEMDALKGLLEQSLRVLKPGGRLCIITYHSIEDRMVKNFIRSGNIEGDIDKDIFGNVSTPWKAVTRSPIVPDEAEIEANPRSRSAKLRVAEKK